MLTLQQINFVLFGAFVCGSGIVIYGQQNNIVGFFSTLGLIIFASIVLRKSLNQNYNSSNGKKKQPVANSY